MSNEYLASVNYSHHEQAMIRDLERRRVVAERRIAEFPRKKTRRSLRAAIGSWMSRVHMPHSHEPAGG